MGSEPEDDELDFIGTQKPLKKKKGGHPPGFEHFPPLAAPVAISGPVRSM